MSGAAGTSRLLDREFSVYSQGGEDGIIQFLIQHVPIANTYFVEFGVEDYREANTRFLAVNNGWRGLVIDGDAENVRRIRGEPTFWRLNVDAVHAFITRENINSLLATHGAAGEIGLLSIDIDGNDYWVLEALDVIRPTILIVEYNHRFGPDRAVVVPYDAQFNRHAAHPSGVYFGASLAALSVLASRKGYDLVGCNRMGVNAFFVRSDLRPTILPTVSAAVAYVAGSFHEAWDEAKGRYLTAAEERAVIDGLPLVEVR